MTQALNRLILSRCSASVSSSQPEEYDMVDARGYYASPI
jgi:hypothetical protein